MKNSFPWVEMNAEMPAFVEYGEGILAKPPQGFEPWTPALRKRQSYVPPTSANVRNRLFSWVF
jgi:hypothetical protein